MLACRLLQAGIEEQDEDGMIKGLTLCAQLAYVQTVKTLEGQMIARLQKPALSMEYQNERPLQCLLYGIALSILIASTPSTMISLTPMFVDFA